MEAGRHTWPDDLLDGDGALSAHEWTCVRTRPRWEKKFARWLTGRETPHFLPTLHRETFSHRKRRVCDDPLMPGYVFVVGAHTKRDFVDSGAVVRVLRPESPQASALLDRQLRDIWRALSSGLPVVREHDLVTGQRVEVLSGPLEGTLGRFERHGRGGALVISIDMLGVGVAVELPRGSRLLPVERVA